MTKTFRNLLAIFLACIFLVSCKEDVETNMVLNGKKFLPSVNQPPMNQKDAYYEVFISGAAKVIAADISEPKSAVNKRHWLVKGPDGNKLYDREDVPGFEIECKQSGWHSVRLEVNKQSEGAITCWIFARGEVISPEPPGKKFEVLSPEGKEIETDLKSIELQMHAELFEESELDGIVVMLNGKRISDLALDLSKALTTAQLGLKPGKNTVEIEATVGREHFKEVLTITRNVIKLPDAPKPPSPVVPAKDDTDKGKSKPAPLIPVEPKPKEPEALAAAGRMDFTDLKKMNACTSSGLSTATLSIKAKQKVALESLLIHTDKCGRANITIQSTKETIATKNGITLNQRENEIYLSTFLNGKELGKDEEWTVTITLVADENINCPDTPEFSNLGECNPKKTNDKHLTISGPQKSVVAQIQYLY